MAQQFRTMLEKQILPFWMQLIDHQYGGFYGFVDLDVTVQQNADKGAILNSRLLWTFSAAYKALGDERLQTYAKHAFNFLKEKLYDHEYGGIYWMVDYTGQPINTNKHVYNIAFAIYGLSEYFSILDDPEALEMAVNLYRLLEEKGRDPFGYLEEFDRYWNPVANKELSGPGLVAERTMNTHLHILEAYTNLYRVWPDDTLKESIVEVIHLFKDRIYDANTGHLKAFFDRDWNSLSDVVSYGHDIEASWLIDEAVEVIHDESVKLAVDSMTKHLAESVKNESYRDQSILNEKNGNHVDEDRIWWVQAEAVVGFYNHYQKTNDLQYRDYANAIYEFINKYLVHQESGEWYWSVDKHFQPSGDHGLAEPWKCPYHNGRMCIEMMRRIGLNDS